MSSKIIILLNEDFNEILEIKDFWNVDKYMKRFNTVSKCSDKLKKLLYEETDCCLEIFNNYMIDIIKDYVDNKINYEELISCLEWKFSSKNTAKKAKYNEIFPEFIKLIIVNVDILNGERDEIIVHKSKSRNNKVPVDSDSEFDLDTENEYEENKEDEPEVIDLDLWDHDKLRKPFDLRHNQKHAINNTVNQDFKSGIHCQIMGAGKTFIMLNIIDQHFKKYNKNSVYIILTDRIEILKSWFMINLVDKIKKDYIKNSYLKTNNKVVSDTIFKTQEFWNWEKNFDESIFKTKEYLNHESIKIKHNPYYNAPDGEITYTFNYDRFQKWTDDEIIDMNKFDIKENIINKNPSIINTLNKKLDLPTIWVCNNSFLKAGDKYKKLNYNNIGLVLVDECHSVSGTQNYNMLEYIRNEGTSIIGFSATPLRPVKNAEKQLLNIYGLTPGEEINELNVISNYDMILALNDGVVLPFVHTIISPETDKKSLKINSPNKQELTLRKIIEDYFINNKDLPYKKGVAWVNSIGKIAKDNGVYYKEIKAICGDKIKLYVSYSGNAINPEVNELGEFEKQESNALLLCVNRVKEGSDIKNLDCGMFLDAVKSRSIVSSLQSIGRIMRPDEGKKKKFAQIIECIKVDERKSVESITVGKVLNYYKKILNISSLTGQDNYINKIQELFDETEIINEDGKKVVEIVINKEANIKCKINLNIKEVDWRVFKDALRKELANQLNIKEDDLLEREFTKLKHSVRKLKLGDKVKYKEYAKNNKMEESPEVKYKNWWKGWYEFLGIDASKYPRSKEEFIKICRKAKIKDLKGYYQFAEELNLPSMPEELYVNFTTLYNELDKNLGKRR
jgi:superfamily II DNA or RNA helicase